MRQTIFHTLIPYFKLKTAQNGDRMFMMKLTELLSILPFYKALNHNQIDDKIIHGIEIDDRNVKSGDLFICIKGYTVDGHDYAKQAIENGACAILAEKDVGVSVPTIIVSDTSKVLAIVASKFFNYPTRDLPLIGITGTNGKTTTTYLLESIFNEYQLKTGLIGTIQMKIGDESFPINNTTPHALLLQKTFSDMRAANVDQAIMEVSSHALDLGRVYGCEFDIAVFTNLSQDHLDFHKDLDDYLRAKSLLFAQLGNGYYDHAPKFAILNADDAHVDVLKRSTSQHVMTYGCHHQSDVMATNIKLTLHETSFTLETPVGKIAISSQLIGKFNVYNMLAASSAAIAANVPLEIIKKALENITGVNGRFEQVVAGQNFAVIVDYAHTPDSLENVLQTISGFAHRRVFVVVGCGGDRDRTKRPLMAEISLKYADHTIFTSDNPRTEDPDNILRDMTSGLAESNYEVINDRKQAIFKAIDLAEADDVILIAGKGHETYQEINGIKYDFDDREIAKEAIKKKGLD